ncbi:MAG: acetyl-CoA carboxylase biotin carboxyl carrier protein subunit [Daejeonella sp.]
MLKIKVNNKFDFQVSDDKSGISVNGKKLNLDLAELDSNRIHAILNNKSYNAEIVNYNPEEKTCVVKINSNTYNLKISDQYDELLHQLGLDTLSSAKIADLKAPMPGLVLKILVSEGDEVKKGDNLLVLEAMKMENIIKASADAKIKSIKIKPADKLEKNQVMIIFEK